MGLEAGTYISDLVASNPAGIDDRSTADDHIRLLKKTIKNTFPNLDAAMNATPTELNLLVGLLATAAELNVLNGATVSTAQLNALAALTVGEIAVLDGLLASTAELNLLDGLLVSTTEINYLQGVTSAIQTQLDAKSSDTIVMVDSAGGYPAVSTNVFDLTPLGEATWESFGPTASGANNIWGALDSLPAGTTWVRVALFGNTSSTGSNFIGTKHFYGRKNGTSLTAATVTELLRLIDMGNSTFNTVLAGSIETTIPVTSGLFDLHVITTGAASSGGAGFHLRLIGYGS